VAEVRVGGDEVDLIEVERRIVKHREPRRRRHVEGAQEEPFHVAHRLRRKILHLVAEPVQRLFEERAVLVAPCADPRVAEAGLCAPS
jgi:hypothetical protein